MKESVLMAVSSRKWTAFGSETDSVSDECNSSTAGQYPYVLLTFEWQLALLVKTKGQSCVMFRNAVHDNMASLAVMERL